MNTWSLSLSLWAFLMYLFALGTWCRLWRILDRKLWWLVASGLSAILVHRALEFLTPNSLIVETSSVAISYVALTTSLTVYRFVQRTAIVRLAVNALDVRPDSISEMVAKHMAAQRVKIDFYEAQAKRLGLPLHTEPD